VYEKENCTVNGSFNRCYGSIRRSMTAYAGHQCSVTVIIGDVNLDGSVDSIDLALLYNTTYYAVPLPNRLQYIAADVNYDSSCTMLDFYMLEDYLLGRISLSRQVKLTQFIMVTLTGPTGNNNRPKPA